MILKILKKTSTKNLLIDLTVIIFFSFAIFVNGWLAMHQGAKFNIGYQDTMDHVGSMMRLGFGELPYRDFYYSYGPLMLLVLYGPFLILGKNFFSFFFSFYILLPIIVLIILYFVFRKFFKNNFMSISALYFAYVQQMLIASPSSLRMIFPLLFVPLCLSSVKPKLKWFLIGWIGIIGFFISFEYGLATFVALILIMSLLFIAHPRKKENIESGIFLLFGLATAIIISVIVLIRLGILANLITHLVSTSSFYSNFPATPILLPPAIMMHLWQGPGGILAGLATTNFRFYFVGFFYFASFIYIFLKILKSKFKVDKEDLIVVFLTIYGGISYIRPLTTPTYECLFVAVAPLLLLAGFYLKKIHVSFLKRSNWGSIIFSIFLLYFSITYPRNDNYFTLKTLPVFLDSSFWHNPTKEQVIFDKALGLTIDIKTSTEYRKITEFLISQTNPEERIFIYPFGPYNLLTGRRNPTFSDEEVYRSFYPGGSDAYDKRIIKELEEKETKFVVLNTYNGGNILKIKAQVGIQNYLTWPKEDRIFMLFPSQLNPSFITYLIENYEPVKYFDYAVILKKRGLKINLTSSFRQIQSIDQDYNKIEMQGLKATAEKFKFQITGRYPSFKICWEKPVTADTVEFKISSNFKPFIKFLSKPKIDIFFIENCNDFNSFSFVGSFPLPRNSNVVHHRSVVLRNEKIKGMMLSLAPSEPLNILPSEINLEEFKIGLTGLEQ